MFTGNGPSWKQGRIMSCLCSVSHYTALKSELLTETCKLAPFPMTVWQLTGLTDFGEKQISFSVANRNPTATLNGMEKWGRRRVLFMWKWAQGLLASVVPSKLPASVEQGACLMWQGAGTTVREQLPPQLLHFIESSVSSLLLGDSVWFCGHYKVMTISWSLSVTRVRKKTLIFLPVITTRCRNNSSMFWLFYFKQSVCLVLTEWCLKGWSKSQRTQRSRQQLWPQCP